ncbi:Mdm33 family-domain-containing protein [Syncephalis plumigaleata]|nr:Mdm33 family-domain-containing protein [Syncephalis plumigaleata]
MHPLGRRCFRGIQPIGTAVLGHHKPTRFVSSLYFSQRSLHTSHNVAEDRVKQPSVSTESSATSHTTADPTSSDKQEDPANYWSTSFDRLKATLNKKNGSIPLGIGQGVGPRATLSGIVSQLGIRLNQVTGYDEVVQLKQKVVDSEKAFLAARERLRRAKSIYEEAVGQRAHGQREINALLQRKHAWTDEDVTRFTRLYRDEHSNEQAELAAKSESASAETEVEHRYDRLVDAIRARYHEEQLWSDKIRGASTYGTLALMLINVLLFLSVQTIFEPRKREKLGQHVEQLLEKRAVTHDREQQEQTVLIRRLLDEQHHEFNKLKSSLNLVNDYPLERDIKKEDTSTATAIATAPLPIHMEEENVIMMPSNVTGSTSTLDRLLTGTTHTIRRWTGHQFPSENSWMAAAEGVMAGSLGTLLLTMLFGR